MNMETMMQVLAGMTEEQREAFYKNLEGNLTAEDIQTIKETFFYWRCLNDKEFSESVKQYIGNRLYNELRA